MNKNEISFICDNIITDKDGTAIISETMFSNVKDLSTDYNEINIRLHPEKKRIFDAVYSGAPLKITAKNALGQPEQLRIKQEIRIIVNTPESKACFIDYRSFYNKKAQNIADEISLPGFDLNAAPLLRVLNDGSMRIVFCTLPPVKFIGGASFNLDLFGEKLQKAIKAECLWDDRDLFYIAKPDTSTISEIASFIKSYREKPAPGKL